MENSVGNQLRLKREEKKLSLECVADELRLSKSFIEHLENGNLGKIPSTYLKGYIRSYAKLLSIPDLELNSIEVFQPTTNGWKIFSNQKQLSANNIFFQWITYLIISTLIILVALWWKGDKALSVAENDASLAHGAYSVAQNN